MMGEVTMKSDRTRKSLRLTVSAALLAAAATSAALAQAPPAPTPEFFASHREKLVQKLPEGSLAVFAAALDPDAEVGRVYRQDSDFWYLTGFPEPNAVAVLRPKAADGKRYVLFVRPVNFGEEQWTGWRAGLEGARKTYGADEAYPIDELWKKLPELWRGAGSLYYEEGRDAKFREKLLTAWGAGNDQATSPRPAADAGPILHQMRLVKDPTEEALLRRAVDLSAQGHRAAMTRVKPGRYEYDLKSALVATCLSGGAARMAYPPIVGSGPNSVIFHYDKDDRRMNAGEMIVNDSACEFQMYAADVTRSYPVSGKFTPDQKAIYEIVLAAQKAGFAKVRPGAAFHDVYDATVDVIVDGLLKLGILKGDREEILRTRSYKKLYPHGSSHWLGLNVHDAGSYQFAHPEDRFERYASAETKLEPGMALTVEPGIYIPENAEGVDRRWWNIGVRIEDDVLVTPTGMECLSCSAPRELADVEKAIRGK
jgi:Xaa-Pro aminopeptidase